MKMINQTRICFKSILVLFLVVSCTNTQNGSVLSTRNGQNSGVELKDTLKNKNQTEVKLNEHEILGGWLKESIDQQLIMDSIGVPEKKGTDEYWGATGTYVQNWEYKSLGIILEMESEKQGALKKVKSITITSPCSLKTSQNIGLGSEIKMVKGKYSSLIDKSNSNNETIVVGSLYGGTIITLKDGVVSKVFIGAISE
jgi:hypothetical protein